MASFAKTGGLPDVALAVPKALTDLEVEIAVAMPKYRAVERKGPMSEVARFMVPIAGADRECAAYRDVLPGSEVPIYFLAHASCFDRPQLYGEGAEQPDALEQFSLFSRASLKLCRAIGWLPGVIRANDSHAVSIPAYLLDHVVLAIGSPKTMLAAHNLDSRQLRDDSQPVKQESGHQEVATHVLASRLAECALQVRLLQKADDAISGRFVFGRLD